LVAGAVDKINNAFDECRILVGYMNYVVPAGRYYVSTPITVPNPAKQTIQVAAKAKPAAENQEAPKKAKAAKPDAEKAAAKKKK